MARSQDRYTLATKPRKRGRPTGSTNKGGRPRKYRDAETLQRDIDAYFEEIKGGNNIPARPPTINGLCLALGFSDRFALHRYAHAGDKLSSVVKKAFLIIRRYYEEILTKPGRSPAGPIFWLKNQDGWQDLSHSGAVDHSVTIKIIDKPTPKIDKSESVSPTK